MVALADEFSGKADRLWGIVMAMLLRLFALTCLILGGSLHAWAKPNVLFICVDDLKPSLGCYGDAFAKTPHIDRLASRSLLFESAYCNQAVCSPSRNSLMLGLRPQTLGIYDLATNFRVAVPEAITIAQQFQANGYRTEAMGKIFHRGHGNDEDAASWTVPHWSPAGKPYALPENLQNQVESNNGPRGPAFESAPVEDSFYADGKIAREAVARLEAAARNPDEPFFIAVGFIRPHLPFVAPQSYWDLYPTDQIPMPEFTAAPEGAPEYAGQYGGELRQYRDVPEGRDLGEAYTRQLIRGYYAATSYMDAQLGLVLDALDRTGLSESTIIVFWGDHGWHLGDHQFWCKHTNYEQAARIPFLMSVPGKANGKRTSALIETVDIYPTLCEVAGLPSREGLDGLSFAPLFEDPAQSARESIIHVYPRSKLLGRAIRTARYRMVEWKQIGSDASTAEFELYDYETDPLETRNLAGTQPAVLAQLQAILRSHPEARPQLANNTSTVTPPKTKAPSDRSAAFRKRDLDHDGKLTREEFLLNQPDPESAPARFPIFDANHDGFLSEEEYVKSGKVN